MVSSRNNDINQLSMVDLPTAKIVEWEHNIVAIYYKESDEEFDLKDAKNHTDAIYKLREGKPCHLIVSFIGVRTLFSNSARDYFATSERHAAIRLSQALVIEGLAQKIVANFYKTFNNPSCPIEIFSNEEDAKKWSISLDK